MSTQDNIDILMDYNDIIFVNYNIAKCQLLHGRLRIVIMTKNSSSLVSLPDCRIRTIGTFVLVVCSTQHCFKIRPHSCICGSFMFMWYDAICIIICICIFNNVQNIKNYINILLYYIVKKI
jgi:hypothetical protein